MPSTNRSYENTTTITQKVRPGIAHGCVLMVSDTALTGVARHPLPEPVLWESSPDGMFGRPMSRARLPSPSAKQWDTRWTFRKDTSDPLFTDSLGATHETSALSIPSVGGHRSTDEDRSIHLPFPRSGDPYYAPSTTWHNGSTSEWRSGSA